jgi:hypothetical protein
MNASWQGKPKYSEKTCPDATLSTTNPPRTWANVVGSQRLTASAIARPPLLSLGISFIAASAVIIRTNKEEHVDSIRKFGNKCSLTPKPL